jgi:hypothetical protein
MSFLNILKEREKKQMLFLNIPMNEKNKGLLCYGNILYNRDIYKMYISWDGYLVFFESIIVSGERATRKKDYL